MSNNTLTYIDNTKAVSASAATTCNKVVCFNEGTEFVLPNGTTVSIEKISFLLEALERIIDEAYPEELL